MSAILNVTAWPQNVLRHLKVLAYVDFGPGVITDFRTLNILVKKNELYMILYQYRDLDRITGSVSKKIELVESKDLI